MENNRNEGIEQNAFVERTLQCYNSMNKNEIDELLNEKIIHLVTAYFRHTRRPRDLFHTDHQYIKDYLILEIGAEKKQHLFEEVKLIYDFRVIYPKADYNDDDTNRYEFEKRLFDRVLFNKVEKITQVGINFAYFEPEKLIDYALKEYLEKGKALNKSVWAGLYFALKETEISLLEAIFEIRTEENRKYEHAMWHNMHTILCEAHFLFSDNASAIVHDREYDPSCDDSRRQFLSRFAQLHDEKMQKLEHEPKELSQAQKTLIKGFLFICMWEKASYTILHEKNIDEDLLEMQGEKIPTGFEENINFCNNKLFLIDIHELFMNEPIEQLPSVLNEVSKRLGMNENGFDYSFLDLDKPIINTRDIITLLYSFSRIERESTLQLLNIVNLIRKRQEDNKFNIKFPQKTKQMTDEKFQRLLDEFFEKYKELRETIDIGYQIKSFESTLSPLRNMEEMLRNSDLDNTYIFSEKRVKFSCEGDSVYIKEGEEKYKFDKRATNKIYLDTSYLYKIRNQAAHFDLDQSIDNLIKPKNAKTLLLFLIDAFCKYDGISSNIMEHWQNNGILPRMLNTRAYRLIAPLYVSRHIRKLIQVVSMIVAVKKENELTKKELEKFKFNYFIKDENNAKDIGIDYLLDLEKYLESIEDSKLSIDSYALNDDEMIKQKQFITEIYGGSKIIVSLDSVYQENIFKNYTDNVESILIETLNFLLSSDTLDYNNRTQFDSFLKTHHATSSFYMLYLSQYFFDGLNVAYVEK